MTLALQFGTKFNVKLGEIVLTMGLWLRQHRRPPFVSQALRGERASGQAADEAAEASKISSRRLQNRGPRGSKWAPGGLPGGFKAKAVFEAILEAILTLRPPPLWGLQNRQ